MSSKELTISAAAPNAASFNTLTDDRRSYRLTSLDMLRGLVLVIMVLDHVRDFMIVNVHDPMSDPNTSPFLFLTRWITHFCAPVFVLLAGVSAGLMTTRKTSTSVGAFLLKRGLWLILVEMFLVSTAWTFSPFGLDQMGGKIMIGMQVIWAIGASMVVLAGLQFLGWRFCLGIGAIIIFGHNFLDAIWPVGGFHVADLPLWVALHSRMNASVGPFNFMFSYPLLPWIGVMAFGFGVAPLFEYPPEKRNALLLKIGIGITVAFVLIRALSLFGDSRVWVHQPDNLLTTVMSFFNPSKYPPSLHYLLMTLGPAAIVCAYADRFNGWVKDTLVMFGRVPFVFYIAHLYIAHAIAVAIGVYQGHTLKQMSTFFIFFPKHYGLSLPGIYVVWLLMLAMLYPICRWIAAVKARRSDWWLSYV